MLKNIIFILLVFTFSVPATHTAETPESPVSIQYDFDTVSEQQDSNLLFEPVGIQSGWLADLTEGSLSVNLGMLDFADVQELYIDIKGKNGNVRLLENSMSVHEGYKKTLFWSAKQQNGASVIKDFSGEIKCAVLFELPDGSAYLTGYINGDGTDFWTLELPETGCYVAVSARR